MAAGLGSLWLRIILVLCASTSAPATNTQDSRNQVEDALREAQYNATLAQEIELLLGFEDAHDRGDAVASTHHNFFADLFRRQEQCRMFEAGRTYTCVDSSDLCCNVGGYGWCCANTAGCGTTSDQCTFDVEWTTSTYYSTDYEYYTSTIYNTYSMTSTMYSYTTITAEMDTATEWVTVTSEAPRAGRRGAPAEPTATAASRRTIFPSYVSALPSVTPAPDKFHRQELRARNTTPALLYIQIRGLIFPRQNASRTDTSETIVTDTTTVESTYYTTSIYTDVEYTTSYSTRTAAINAQTTVTSTTTFYLQPGETAPASSADDGDYSSGGGSSGGSVRRKGISTAARAGIGIGVALVVAGIAALISFFAKKRKNEKAATGAAAAGINPAPMDPPMAQSQPYNSPPLNPPGSPMIVSGQQYQQMTPSPPISYGAPSPGPVYGYQSAPVPVAASPPLQQQQQQYAYQYPRPPSPSYGSSAELATGGGIQQHVGQGLPSEMPAVYSPHPQRLS
ncbi:hypothetical protein BU23DRAFT_227283 [Bimuria novae-zelandiae CBS 107.79]|uniref:Mid2 domain-containing protein n=1 Tax=Bimuria novae-zelandiae CBS 107.79 TaxID=1447943 RepID=A0A6A5VPP0_9PLEO|nr:hypothetical protein BU23DRAFT_227283 [Bimuria novae-zelandiae CBS 107.79]